MPVDNELYNQAAWWDDDAPWALLRTALTPARFDYSRDVLTRRLGRPIYGLRMLDVGCGGGFLAEEFARLGARLSGVDPSAPTIAVAQAHAAAAGLTIDYQVAAGEALPFADATFDAAYCCDVLEHVSDLARVIAETARVLKPGGVYLYDTINRTPLSQVLLVTVGQRWAPTRLLPPGLHDGAKFIRPPELLSLMGRLGLANQDLVGLHPGASPRALLGTLIGLRRGRLSYAAAGRRLQARVHPRTTLAYMGYATKLAPLA